MKVLKKEDMKQVKGGLAAGGPREQFCKNMMQLCFSNDFNTIGYCVNNYMTCMFPS